MSDTQVRVCCDVCGHSWIAATLPMDMEKFAKAMKSAKCEKCGAGSKKIKMVRGGAK